MEVEHASLNQKHLKPGNGKVEFFHGWRPGGRTNRKCREAINSPQNLIEVCDKTWSTGPSMGEDGRIVEHEETTERTDESSPWW